jgi:nitroreductase
VDPQTRRNLMSTVLDNIKNRRSIRQYLNKDVPENILTEIIEAVRWSPSWANTQCCEVVVVKDSEVKAKLQKTVSTGNPAHDAIIEAPVIVAMCAKPKLSGYYKNQSTTKFGDWFMFDLGIATQTLCLAAHSLGLGTVVVGLLDHNSAASILNLPDEHELVCLIPVGYPAKVPSAPNRRETEEFIHDERF